MASSLKIKLGFLGSALLFLLAGLAQAKPAASPSALAAPAGLTLHARAPGKFTLLWDRIDADDLIGYSVWARRPGEEEFTRLTVPVVVAGETRKMPVVSEAKLDLKLGVGREMEFAVLAEYEGGRQSAASPSAFTRLAAGQAVASVPSIAPALGAAVPLSPSAEPKPEPKLKAKVAPALPAALEEQETPHEPIQALAAFSPMLTPRGKLRTRLSLSFDFQRYIRSGRDVFGNLGLLGTGIDPAKTVNYNRIDVRTIFRVPLRASFGVSDGLEAWAEAAYHAEDAYIDDYYIDNENFDYIRRVSFDSSGNLIYLSNPTSVGIGDVNVGMRARLAPDVPLVLGLSGSVPTGSSRFKNAVDSLYFSERSTAGTGEGVPRFMLSVAYGEKAVRSGLYMEASFKPSSVERYVRGYSLLGVDYGSFEHLLVRGEVLSLGGGYTIPYALGRQVGALILGVTGRSVNASRWTVNGIDPIKDGYHPVRQNFYSANMDTRFVRDDQLELSVELLQRLGGGLEAGGRVYYRMQVFGDTLGGAGTFYY